MFCVKWLISFKINTILAIDIARFFRDALLLFVPSTKALRSIALFWEQSYRGIPAIDDWISRRRKMETEEKENIVASVWWAKCIQYFAALAVLLRSLRKKRMNSTFSSKSTEVKQLARQGIQQIFPQKNRRDDLCLCFCLHPFSMESAHLHLPSLYPPPPFFLMTRRFDCECPPLKYKFCNF